MGEIGINTFLLYVPVFKMGSPEALIKFYTTLQKIIKSQSLMTGPQMYAMINNLLSGESLCVFKDKAKTNRNDTK